MRHVRLRHHCSLCEAIEMLGKKEIPVIDKLEAYNLLKEVSKQEAGAIDCFERVVGEEDVFTFLSDSYRNGGSSASIFMTIKYKTTFDGVLHVLPAFTSSQVELDSALRQTLERRDNGSYHDQHEPH